MTRTGARFSSVLGFVLAVAGICLGQVTRGTPPFGSYAGGPFDTVNLANLNVHFAIPVISKAGRGLPFVYSIPYDSSVWYPATVGQNQVWTPVTNFGWPAQQEVATGDITYTTFTTPCFDPDFGTIIVTHWIYKRFRDAEGVDHKFNVSVADDDTCGAPLTGSQVATDGSGYTLIASSETAYVTSRTGWGIYPPGTNPGNAKIKDTNGNYISVNSGSGTFTDTLGKTALTVSGTGTAASPLRFKYTNPGGTLSEVVLNYTTFNVKTNFGCSGINEATWTNVPLATTIALPDGSSYTIDYEVTPGFPTYRTGRIKSITLPTGGQIQYAYTGANNGIVCADGSAAGLTRTLTPGGAWTYGRTQISGDQWKTTVTDPQNNQAELNFQALYETSRKEYEGAAGGTPLRTVVTCYNGNVENCDTTAVTEPISSRDVILQLPGGKQSKQSTSYHAYGMVTDVRDYDLGDGAPGALIRTTSYGYLFLGNAFDGWVIRPSGVNVMQGSTFAAQTGYTYDEGTVTTTTATPQHTSPTSARGNLTTITSLVSGNYIGSGVTLARHFTYYDTGNVKTATDVNNAVTTYVYGSGSCGNSFVTEVDLPLTLKRYTTWDSPTCNGAVVKSFKDENNNITSYGYTDANYWRVTSITDPLSNVTNITYPTVNSVKSSLSFNSGNSVVEVRATVDGFGRTHLVQRLQGPGLSTYDSTQTDYDSLGRVLKAVLPFSAGVGSDCTGACPGVTAGYDPLSRTASVTDASTGVVSYDYTPGGASNNNVVLLAVDPPPTGETSKKRQFEFDGLGRLSSVCELTGGSGNGTCSQPTTQQGYWTRYTYDALGHVVGVSQNAQSTQPQGRTFTYDKLGRMTSESNPETGTTNYTYDSASGCTGTYNGDLVKRVDAKGNTTCYAYDSLHRVTSMTYSGPYAGNTPSKKFVYDTATVNGVAMANAKGRLAEAYTCTTCPGTKITDLGFSYSVRGEVLDVYQSTPHSSGYHKVTAAYWANGALNKIQNLVGLPTITYGVDGQGRTKIVSASSGQNPVSNTIYNTASQVTEVDFGSLDKDTFQYDSNTGRMTQYKFYVGTPTVTGNLTWNANGTLRTLAITDGLNSANTQTCTYGYDDLARITSANCGAAWNQTFSFDPFGNIAKSGTSSFAAGYLLVDGSTNNRIQTLPGVTPTYDTNGNLTSDGTHTYSWDAEGRPVQMDTTTLTYDALGRMVEKGVSSVYTEMVYSPMGGKLALMNGQALVKAFVPLPGGATAVYTASGLAYYRHTDWLGSSRLASTPTRTLYSDTAYGPYGENYAGSGTTDLSFTGQNQDAVAGHYDFLFREYNPVHGRWFSPDPAGVAAVRLGDPQTWNRFGYVRNLPTLLTDPLGLYWACVTINPYPPDCHWYEDERMPADQGGVSGPGVQPAPGPGPISPGGGPGGGGGGGGQPQTPQQKKQACQKAKAELNSINSQIAALDSSLRSAFFTDMKNGALIGCGVGVLGGEAAETPLIGTPMALGNCAVGAIGGGLTANGVFALGHLDEIGKGLALTVSQAKAVANVISACN